jgi:tetratricopeptide (TPR) repeat protein
MNKPKATKGRGAPDFVRHSCEKLRKMLRDAQFLKAKDFLQEILQKLPVAESAADECVLEELYLRSMAAEVFDYWGMFREAAKVIEGPASWCKVYLEDLRINSPGQLTDQQRKLLKQQVWIQLHAGMTEYRKGQLDKAMELFELSEYISNAYLVSSADEACGTRARILYSVALIYRERSDFEAARTAFNESVEHAYRSLEKRDDGYLSKLTYISIAKSLGLGLGFIHSAAGRPDLAFPLLLSAKTILLSLGEDLISAYIDLIYANTVRGKSGDSANAVTDVIACLSTCYRTFQKEHHDLYVARAAYSLGSAYAQRARLDEKIPLSESGRSDLDSARKCADDIRRYSKVSGDTRFGLYAELLQSRIYRKRDELEKAVSSADRIIRIANKTEALFVEALIAKGEALARKGDLEGAIVAFELALRNGKNPRLRASSVLHLARLYSCTGRTAQAMKAMNEFDELKPSVTHVQTKILEAEARAAMKQSTEDLLLNISDKELDPKQVDVRVKAFKVAWAKKHSANDSEAAKKLGISRQTFYNWLSEGADFLHTS